MAIDFNTIKTFSNGIRVLNATPHPLSFLDGDTVVTVAPSGAKINARAVETAVGSQGAAQFVKTIFETSPEGLEELEEVDQRAPGTLVIGSMISAQAYPGRVFAMVAAPGFERVPPAEKRMRTDKFTTF